MMIMVTTPVSVVTYAIIAGELAIAAPATPSTRLLKALWDKLTGQRASPVGPQGPDETSWSWRRRSFATSQASAASPLVRLGLGVT